MRWGHAVVLAHAARFGAHLEHRINDEGDGHAPLTDDEQAGGYAARGSGDLEEFGQVDHTDDRAAKLHDAQDPGRRVRHGCHIHQAIDSLHARSWHRTLYTANHKDDIAGPLGHVVTPHAP